MSDIRRGTVTSWGGGGFGWLVEDGTGVLWFAHVEGFDDHPGHNGPPVGSRVQFVRGQDGHGRRRAEHIRIVEDR